MERLTQLVAAGGNGFGLFSRFRGCAICDRFPAVATTGLDKRLRSILRWQSWRHAEVFTLGTCLERARKRVASRSWTLAQADTVLVWDAADRSLIAANLRGTMPWTKDPATPGTW